MGGMKLGQALGLKPSTTCRLPPPKQPSLGSHRIHVWKSLPTWMVKNGHIQQCWVSHFFWRFIILYPVKWTRMSIHIFLNSRQLKKSYVNQKFGDSLRFFLTPSSLRTEECGTIFDLRGCSQIFERSNQGSE